MGDVEGKQKPECARESTSRDGGGGWSVSIKSDVDKAFPEDEEKDYADMMTDPSDDMELSTLSNDTGSRRMSGRSRCGTKVVRRIGNTVPTPLGLLPISTSTDKEKTTVTGNKRVCVDDTGKTTPKKRTSVKEVSTPKTPKISPPKTRKKVSTPTPKTPKIEQVSPPEKNEAQAITCIPKKSATKSESDDVFSWKKFLMANPKHDLVHVPVYAFVGAPLQETWDQFSSPDLKAEFQVGSNLQTEDGSQKYSKVFWIGTIRKYFGYLAKVEDEGYPEAFKEVPYQWLNFLTECFPIGNCTTLDDAGLVPPPKISKCADDWRNMILNRLANRMTIHKLVAETFKVDIESGLKIGLKVEVLDYNNTSRMKAGVIADIKGSRIFVRYWDSDNVDPPSGLWFDIRSTWMGPPGWCKAVGHELSAEKGYDPKPLTDDYFDQEEEEDEGVVDIQVGMKLEAIFPLKPNYIVAATVVSVLKFGFMMISDMSLCHKPEVSEGVSFQQPSNNTACFNISSTQIFPCGYSQKLGIEIIPPPGFQSAKKVFNWKTYFDATGDKPLPITRSSEPGPAGFAVGSKLEAVDLSNVNISNIRLATIDKTAGPLVRIRFDGLPEKSDQWMHHESCNIYPVGWCDTFKHQLLGPTSDSRFWKKYKHQNLYIPRGSSEITRRNAPLAVTQSAEAEKRGCKRKAKDILETAIFNSSMMKVDAVKLGSKKPQPLRKSTLEELRNSFKNANRPASTAVKVE